MLYWCFTFFLAFLFPFSLGVSGYLLKEVQLHSVEWSLIFFSLLVTLILIRKTTVLQVVYILFHEISHAIAALISKGEIYEIKVNRNFGYVKSDKNNLIIRLAPYLLPLLPILSVAFVGIVKLIFKIYFYELDHFFLDKFFLLVTSALFFSTTYYNFYLLKSETTDVNSQQVLFSLVLIANTYTVSSALTIAVYFTLDTFIQSMPTIL